IKLGGKLPKHLIGLYMYFHTRHVTLNVYLHGINHSESPQCPICKDTDKTINHFLFICPQYDHECHVLANALGHKATSIPFL
ncbi:hypothetical protein BDR06DRAFT_852690, partial [Suillus hirtellus]